MCNDTSRSQSHLFFLSFSHPLRAQAIGAGAYILLLRQAAGSASRSLAQVNWRNRRVIVLLLALCLTLYWSPQAFRWIFHRRLQYNAKEVTACLDSTLHQFGSDLDNLDAAKWDGARWHTSIPYVGNGYFGVAIEGSDVSDLYIPSALSAAAALDVETGLNLLVRLSASDVPSASAYLTLYKSGVVRRFQYYGWSFGQCLEIEHEIAAHRVYPWLLQQSITLRNSLPHSVDIVLDKSTGVKLKNWTSRVVDETRELASGVVKRDNRLSVVAFGRETPPKA